MDDPLTIFFRFMLESPSDNWIFQCLRHHMRIEKKKKNHRNNNIRQALVFRGFNQIYLRTLRNSFKLYKNNKVM